MYSPCFCVPPWFTILMLPSVSTAKEMSPSPLELFRKNGVFSAVGGSIPDGSRAIFSLFHSPAALVQLTLIHITGPKDVTRTAPHSFLTRTLSLVWDMECQLDRTSLSIAFWASLHILGLGTM